MESEIGRGSTFHVTVPMRIGTADPIPARAADAAALHGLPVLIVDDNATNRRILVELLRGWRMKPVAVADGAAALAAMRRTHGEGRPFPLALLDGHMPEMDGFELAERIRTAPELGGTSLILLTSSGKPGDRSRCRSLGVAYLMKPIMQAELLKSIEIALGSRPAEDHPTSAEATPDRPGSRLRILLAEDTPVNRTVVLHLLEKRGHAVVAVENGHEAVRAVERGSFDVVLMDVQMPEMDGIAATVAIRAAERASGRHIPIVAMTAHAMKGDRERCLEAGMDAYVSKPLQPAEVFATIESVAGGSVDARPRASTGRAAAAGRVLNQAALRSHAEDDADLILRLIEIFAEDSKRMLEAIRDGIVGRTPNDVMHAAHRLKGSLSTLGAETAAELAHLLERLGTDGNLAGAEDALARLQDEIGRLDVELATVREDALARRS
jgi:CheY-like chemotaxis protein